MEQQPYSFDQVAALHAPPPQHTITYGSAPQQFGHLRLPAGTGPFPVVIFIHGGCYRAEYTIAHAAAYEQAIADAGYAVWSLEYRRVGDPGGGWPGTFQDVASGADHLRALATKYSLDLTHVVASGHSAGGNMALWLAGRAAIARESPLWVSEPLPIGGVLALAPAGDLAELHEKKGCGGMVDPLMGGSPSAHPDRYKAASHAALLPAGVPARVIIAERDEGFRDFGRSLAARLVDRRQLRVVNAPGAGHFDVIAPPTATWQIVLQAVRDLMAMMK